MSRTELTASPKAIQHFERLLKAAENGGTLRCIEKEDGSTFWYIKKSLRGDPAFINRVLNGEPGPKPSAEVLLIRPQVGAGALEHMEALARADPAAEALMQRASRR